MYFKAKLFIFPPKGNLFDKDNYTHSYNPTGKVKVKIKLLNIDFTSSLLDRLTCDASVR